MFGVKIELPLACIVCTVAHTIVLHTILYQKARGAFTSIVYHLFSNTSASRPPTGWQTFKAAERLQNKEAAETETKQSAVRAADSKPSLSLGKYAGVLKDACHSIDHFKRVAVSSLADFSAIGPKREGHEGVRGGSCQCVLNVSCCQCSRLPVIPGV